MNSKLSNNFIHRLWVGKGRGMEGMSQNLGEISLQVNTETVKDCSLNVHVKLWWYGVPLLTHLWLSWFFAVNPLTLPGYFPIISHISHNFLYVCMFCYFLSWESGYKLLWTVNVCPEPQGTPPMKKPRKDKSDLMFLSVVACFPHAVDLEYLFYLLCRTKCPTNANVDANSTVHITVRW